MATRQPLRGGSEKIYEVITNFSQGINKKVADDISLDSSFKELKNTLIEEGNKFQVNIWVQKKGIFEKMHTIS